MSRSLPSTAEEMWKKFGNASLNGEGNGTREPPSEQSPYGFDSLRHRQEISAMTGSWAQYLPPALDDKERLKQINHCFMVFVTGEYEASPVDNAPDQVRVTNHEGACEVYNTEALYKSLYPIGSSQEVRDILVNGGLEL